MGVLYSFIYSLDSPTGNGDHENFFKDTRITYELNGSTYRKCEKIAMMIRSKEEMLPWYELDNTILFSNRGKYYWADIKDKNLDFYENKSATNYFKLPTTKYG